MSARCTTNHRSDETRLRCHNAECRQRAITSRARLVERGAAPPRADEMITVPDSRGNPINISLTNPHVRGRALGREASALLPAGTRLESCSFVEGDFLLTDVTLKNCRVLADTRMALSGHAVISGSTIRGQVVLRGDAFSSGNTYHSRVEVTQRAQSANDYFAAGYHVPDGDPVVVSSPSGNDANEMGAQQSAAPQRARGGLLLMGLGEMVRRMPMPRMGLGARRGGGGRRRRPR